MKHRRGLTLSVGAVGSAAALTLGLMVATPSVSASADIPSICVSELNVAKSFGVDTSRLSSGILTLDGRTLSINEDPQSWRVFDPVDNTFNNRFHGLQWLVPWAVSGGDAVSLVLARTAALPDPGADVDQRLLRATGWTTGANRLRQNTVNCLYELTSDERLRDVIEGIVAVNLDPKRYRGLPNNTVHNHGMLANHALIESARVFDRPDWESIAFRRMTLDAESVFDACGMSIEQSSSYHLTNLRVWERGIRRADSASVRLAEAISSRIATARWAALKLARPDRILEAIGNANQRDVSYLLDDVDSETLDTQDTALWCPDRGWAANRTSWSPDAIHYTLRFGPRRKMHGHQDHGSLTWFAHGVPVLSDPGLFDKSRSPRYRQAISSAAHSVMTPSNRGLPGLTRGFREDSNDGVDRYRLVNSRRDISRIRQVEISMTEPSLRVRDAVQTRWTTQWYQRWQLAPEWKPVSGSTAWTPVAAHPQGLYLYAVCHSRMSMRMTAGTQEHYPRLRTVVPATTLYCGGMDRSLLFDTLLVVSPIRGTLTWDRASGAYSVEPVASIQEG